MAVDTSLAFAAFPEQNLLQAYDEGQRMRINNQLGNLKVQGTRNALAVETASHIARGVLNAENPEAAYPAALDAARSMGLDVSTLPSTYDERAKMIVGMLAMPEGERTEFERLAAGLPAGERERALRVKLGLEEGAGRRDFALDRRIEALVGTGLDEQTATAIAAGRYVTSRDPVTGTATIIDKASGTPVGAAPPEATDIAEATEETVPGGTLYEKAPQATGVVPAAKELATNIFGQVPGLEELTFEETVQLRQDFSVAANDMIRGLSVNPKMPVAEINRIRDEISILPSLLRSGGGLQAKMRSVDNYLKGSIRQQEELARDPSMPADARKSAAENVASMKRFRQVMGVPQDGERAQPSEVDFSDSYDSLPTVGSQEEYDKIPIGGYYIGPDGNVRQKP